MLQALKTGRKQLRDSLGAAEPGGSACSERHRARGLSVTALDTGESKEGPNGHRGASE